jgi:lipid-A-disaccharide synthase-like uncharacterized protein
VNQFIGQHWVFAIGFAAQGIFAIRMAAQWVLSESKGSSQSPIIFWQLSLLGSFMLLLYGGLRNDFVIIAGQTLSYFIFIRNLVLSRSWFTIALPMRVAVVCLPIVLLGYLSFNGNAIFNSSFSHDTLTLFFIVGMVGQLLMSFRFVHQWYLAEKTGVSDIPLAFWYFTLLGSVLILVYAVKHLDPVLLVAQSFSLISSIRNIQLHKKKVNGNR